VYLCQLRCTGMLAAYFCKSPLINNNNYECKADFAASALLVQSGGLLAGHNCLKIFWNCPMLSQPKSAVHKQAAKLFQ